MFKIIIADDKSFEREKIKSILDWRHFGVEIVGEAGNGREALDLCLRHKPDVLITDIRMPVMNGIELTRALDGVLPDTRIIYLSSYDEFEYAQQAVALNVRSYLLKPYSEKDMIDVLLQILEEINDKNSRIRHTENQSRLIQGNLVLLRQAFFQEMMAGPFEPQTFWGKADVLGLKLSSDSYLLLGIKVGSAATPWYRRPRDPVTALRESLLEGVPSYVDEYHLFEDGGQMFVLFCIRDQRLSEAKSGAAQLVLNLRTRMSERSFQVDAQISSIGYGPASWRRLYWEAGFHDPDVHQDGSSGAERIYEEYRRVEAEIISSLIDPQQDYSSRLLEEVIGRAPDGIKAIHLTKVCLSFYCAMQRIPGEHRAARGMPSDGWLDQLDEILALDTAQDALNWMKGLLPLARQQLVPFKKKRNTQIVEQVLEIIRDEYGAGIDVTDISNRVFISQNYLRSIFKEHTGKSLSAYLCDYRVEKACELLRDTSCKITEIPERVGLADSPYFFFLFKKSTGFTPGEYRAQHSDQ